MNETKPDDMSPVISAVLNSFGLVPREHFHRPTVMAFIDNQSHGYIELSYYDPDEKRMMLTISYRFNGAYSINMFKIVPYDETLAAR